MSTTSSRLVHYYVATTVDGFIARADGSFDCFPTEGDHLAAYLESLAGFDTVLMGRKTYEVGLRHGVTNPYPSMKAIVFSRTMETSPDPNVELVRTDPAERVHTLRDEPGGNIYLCGGAALAGLLLRAGLVDELTVKVNPLVLGEGLPLFSTLATSAGPVGPIETRLQLRSQRSFDSGVVFVRYRVVPASAVG
jgi:dihydrofolate reductase